MTCYSFAQNFQLFDFHTSFFFGITIFQKCPGTSATMSIPPTLRSRRRFLFWVRDHSPNASQNFTRMQNSQELVFCGRSVKVGCFLIDKEGVGDPDKLNILCPHYKFLETQASLEGEPRVPPKLAEVHVECKVLQNVGCCSLSLCIFSIPKSKAMKMLLFLYGIFTVQR